MNTPDRDITRAHITVVSETLSEREMEIDLAVKLKDYEIDSIRVERAGETSPKEETNGNEAQRTR